MHQSDLMAHPPDSGGQGCAAIIQPPSRFRAQSLFPWASLDRSRKHRPLAVRGFAGPYACVSAGAGRRGCGDVSVGPSEGQLGPGPPPRGIGGPWPRPALRAGGRRLARPGGGGSPARAGPLSFPVLGVGRSGPSVFRFRLPRRAAGGAVIGVSAEPPGLGWSLLPRLVPHFFLTLGESRRPLRLALAQSASRRS